MEDLTNIITIGVLRQTVLVKLYTYLVFFSYNNEKFSMELKRLIRKLRLLIDPKSGKVVDRELEMLHRKSLIEKLVP